MTKTTTDLKTALSALEQGLRDPEAVGTPLIGYTDELVLTLANMKGGLPPELKGRTGDRLQQVMLLLAEKDRASLGMVLTGVVANFGCRGVTEEALTRTFYALRPRGEEGAKNFVEAVATLAGQEAIPRDRRASALNWAKRMQTPLASPVVPSAEALVAMRRGGKPADLSQS